MDEKVAVEEGEINEDDDGKDDREDIPDNFFDDFNNEGFMESLQIVDSVDDYNIPDETEEIRKDEEEQNDKSIKKSQEKSVERSRNKRSREPQEDVRSKDRKLRDGSPHHRKRKIDDMALRRDPNKTKRDLEKDRENFVKKKEQKVISKIIETGLVPPGMESEANLNIIETENREKTEKNEKKDDFTKNHESTKRTKDRKSSREKRISRERRRRSRSRSYGRYRSRSRDRRTERTRDNLKSFDTHTKSRSRDRSRVYDRDSYSPSRRRRSRSKSDRERWLKDRYRSPERKYQGMVREKKMSFLEEIKMKLNGGTPSGGGDMVTYPFPKNPVLPKFPDNVPMPVGQSIPQYNQNYLMGVPSLNSNYNEDFFIGSQPGGQIHHNVAPMHHNVMPMQQNMSPMQTNMAIMPPNLPSANSNNAYMQRDGGIQIRPEEKQGMVSVNAYNSSAPMPNSEITNKVSELMARISASTKAHYNQKQTSDRVEKQLSLTNFLHSTKSSEFSSDSEALKKKVDVLSRCQDFLKEISGEKQFCGKLKVMKTNHIQKDETNVSPLLRQNPIRFSFNSPISENSYQDILDRTLIKLGIVPEVIDLVEDDDEEPSATLKRSKAPFDIKFDKPNMSMKMCQTDPVKCEDCEKRKAVQYKSIGIQCGETERFNVGVQVVEEDIVTSRIPKTQSLAYLTPAQLLGRSDPVVSRADSYGAPSSERPGQHAYRDAMSWNRPRDYYDDPGRDYQVPYYDDPGRDYQVPQYGPGREAIRDPRYARY